VREDMLKSIEHLLKKEAIKQGNHSRKDIRGNIQEFIYFDTIVCMVYHEKKTCYIHDGGWNTSSTRRVINDYIRYFENLEYTIVDCRRK
jgi:hypothetical protein